MSGVRVERGELGGFTHRTRPAFGMRPTLRFALAAVVTVAYVGMAISVSSIWRGELEDAIGPVMAWVIPIFMAYIPAVVIGFLCFTLIFTRYQPPPLRAPIGSWPSGDWPEVTVIIAACNEQESIEWTLDRIAATTYPGVMRVVLADNNSADRTAELAHAAARRLRLDYRRSFEPVAGKHNALNTALVDVTTPIVLTVDADTGPHAEALTYLVARLASRPQDQHVCACAGALIAENANRNFLTRMQGWDYRLGINGVKRMQAAYNSALVAQGAFSAYWTDDIRAVGGWPDAIGEDIVLTWSLMDSRGLGQYEPAARAVTVVPDKVAHFMRQRSRWARGMIEGIRINPPQRQPRVLAKCVAGIDYLVPFLDIGYVFFWIPGVILFIFGYPLLFSWWSMLVIPITVLIYGLLRRWQDRQVFQRLGVHPAPDRRGFFGYLFGYQALTSAASLRGYAQQIAGAARRWR
ncbi:MAG: glycosyltransferase family 2 protein [Solirubrobacteraceae bacterium]